MKTFSLKRKGFTLVELLIVIGMLALLLSILIPTLTHNRKAGHGPRHTAPNTWVFDGYGNGHNDTFSEDLSQWLNEHPAYHLTTQNGTDFDYRGRPQKYLVTTSEAAPVSVER